MIYTVTLNPAIDYVVKVDSFNAGQINRTISENVVWGGKGINVSLVLKMLDVDSTALGFVAGFTGKAFSDAVGKMGINTDFIEVKSGMTRINMKLHAMDNDEETEINGSGPIISQDAVDMLMKKLDLLKAGDILVLAGSIPKGVDSNIYANICKGMKAKGIKTVIDTSGKALLDTLVYEPFLIKPNHIEAGYMLDMDISSYDDARKAGVMLHDMGAKNVLISMAEKGAVLIDEKGEFHTIKAPLGEVVNSVGAGDSMLAGFIAGYITTADYNTALKYGTAAGSATAFSVGTANKEDFDSIYSQL